MRPRAASRSSCDQVHAGDPQRAAVAQPLELEQLRWSCASISDTSASACAFFELSGRSASATFKPRQRRAQLVAHVDEQPVARPAPSP